MLRGLVLAAAAGSLLAACGASATIEGSPPAHATPVAVVTEADSGRTVRMAVGDRAVVHLAGSYTWSTPLASGGAVQVAPAAIPAGEWTLTAVTPGSATVIATGRPPCPSGAICPQIVRAFTLTVIVG